MKKLVVLLLAVFYYIGGSGQDIVQVEYSIDTDAGFSNNKLVNVTPASDGTFSFTVNLFGVAVGNHKLYIRTKDNNGKWSQTTRRDLQVLHSPTTNNIVSSEYFIDADPGVGLGTPITVSSQNVDVSQTFAVANSGLTPGTHKLYIRSQDSHGNWSITSRRSIEVPFPEAISIVSGEYFFDNDPGVGNASAITVAPEGTNIVQNFLANTSSLALGFHKLYIRMKDAQGKWGLTIKRNVEVVKANGTGNIVATEFFFNEDAGFGNCVSFTFQNPAADGTFSFNIPFNQIPSGADTLFVRVKDSTNSSWSLTQWKIPTITLPLTLVNFTANAKNNLVTLSWITTNEINTNHFNVQRSVDGISFTNIGMVNARGYSSSNNHYNHPDDISRITSNKIYYRLQMVDRDGKTSFSPAAVVNISSVGRYSITPNPARNYFTIRANGNTRLSNTALVVRDFAGHTVLQQKLSTDASQVINIEGLSKGMYTVSVISTAGTQTEKLIVK